MSKIQTGGSGRINLPISCPHAEPSRPGVGWHRLSFHRLYSHTVSQRGERKGTADGSGRMASSPHQSG